MKNWSTNTKKLKQNKDKFAVWKLEQLVNFGLGKEKIQELEPLVKKHISRELKLIGRSKGDSNLFWKTLVIADGKKMKQFLGSTTTTLLINLMI